MEEAKEGRGGSLGPTGFRGIVWALAHVSLPVMHWEAAILGFFW